MKVTECPRCGETDIRRILVKERKIQQQCTECGWKGEPEIPETKPILSFKDVHVDQFYGHNYEIFDQYGQHMVFSRSYDTEAKAEEAMIEDLKACNKTPGAAPCTGILWPSTIRVHGKKVRIHNNEVVTLF